MKASQTLRRPSNWQDFESLCKKLWGEIWNCPEIKKNGRIGQTQHGVDVYGIPFGESEYYGIQCKGKDEYTNTQFTKKEIITEIEKAKFFQPPLKKLYFATTAVKDVVIEEFVRDKNLEHKNKGLFEIHLFSWEDIVELIDENKQTHDYYLKSQNYKSKKSVSITFQNGLSELTIIPKFKKTITHFKQKIKPANPFLSESFSEILRQQQEQFTRKNPFVIHTQSPSIKINQSFCEICFYIHNTGLDPLEEYKLFFNFEGEIQNLVNDNEIIIGKLIIPKTKSFPDVILNKNLMQGEVIPNKNILVSDDTLKSDELYIKPLPKECNIKVHWKLISKDFKDEGVLKIAVKPNIINDYKELLVEDPYKVGIEESDIEDFLVEKNNDIE